MKHSFKRRIVASREPCFGTWISSSSLVCLDALRELGFEWFMIDTEHAPVNPENLAAMVALLADATPAALVRVGNVDQYLIKQALDVGASGILAPLVSSSDQAELVVKFAKYPPEGVRGVAAAAASRYGRELAPYLRAANAEVTVGVQIETKEAIENLNSIASVEGVDLLFVGPQDLTLNLGLLDDRRNPRVREAMRAVVDACEKNGKVPGILAVDVDERRAALEMGFRFIALASDVRFLQTGAASFLHPHTPADG